MTDDPRLNSPLEANMRAAYQALRALIPHDYLLGPDDADLPGIISELPDVLRLVQDRCAAELGAPISWTGPWPHEDWAPLDLQVDFDDGDLDSPGITFRDLDRPVGEWSQTAFAQAARAYKRECGWDFAPGEAGIWLLRVAPYSASGDGDAADAFVGGHLIGFAIVHDRDEDGEYESLAHLWTATGWRRRGVAAELVRRAREQFPIKTVEEPVTDRGAVLLSAIAPDLWSVRRPDGAEDTERAGHEDALGPAGSPSSS